MQANPTVIPDSVNRFWKSHSFIEKIFLGNNFPKQYTLNTFSACFMHQNFKYFLQNKIWWSELPNCSLVFDEKAALMKFIGKHLCRSFFLNTFLHQEAKERLLHRCFLVISFSKHLWVTASPKYNFLFPLTLVILKFFWSKQCELLASSSLWRF